MLIEIHVRKGTQSQFKNQSETLHLIEERAFKDIWYSYQFLYQIKMPE